MARKEGNVGKGKKSVRLERKGNVGGEDRGECMLTRIGNLGGWDGRVSVHRREREAQRWATGKKEGDGGEKQRNDSVIRMINKKNKIQYSNDPKNICLDKTLDM